MSKKKEITLSIIGVLTLVVIVIGSSYAYYVARTNSGGEGSNVDVRTATLGDTTVTTEGSIGFSDTNIYPGHKNISKIKVTATGDKNVLYNLTWTGTNTLNTPLKYYVYKTTTEETPTITCTKKEEGTIETHLYEECTNSNFTNLGEAISEGTIPSISKSAIYNLVKNESIQATNSGATVYYYIVLEYENKETSQNIDMNGTFNGVVNVTLLEQNPTCNTYLADTALGKLPVNNCDATFGIPSDGLIIYLDDEYKEEYGLDGQPSGSGVVVFPLDEVWSSPSKASDIYDLFDSEGNSFFDNQNFLLNDGILTSSLGDATWNVEANSCTFNGETVYNMITGSEITNADDCKKVYDDTNLNGNTYASFSSYKKVGKIDGIEQKGIYATVDNYGMSYYYRGNVDNNWVKFGQENGSDLYWRIIRINGDGTLRLIYNGTTTDQTGETTQIGTSKFNSSYNDNAYVGYMYGQTGASTYEATHANTNSSTIKQIIDTWYETNMLGKIYEQYIDTNAGFCGDRSLASGTGIGTTVSYYGAYNRLVDNKTPSLKCTNNNDLYTVSSSNKGNKALTYPVGLISADEVAYAGGVYGAANASYYLNTRQWYWTMTPSYFNGSYAGEFGVNDYGHLSNGIVPFARGVRPVINLRADTNFTGDGTTTNPYTISI